MADIFKARSAIDNANPDSFLRMLSVIDQEKHNSTIPSLDRDEPKFYWIFKNMDFEQWEQWMTPSSQVLWLSGPPERSIHQVSSYIVDLLKKKSSDTQHFVLYFFCSSASREKSIASVFIHTLLYQTVSYLPPDKKVSIVRIFLHTLLEAILKNDPELSRFQGEDITIKKLSAQTKELWDALKTVLDDEPKRELSIIVDGLDEVKHQKGEFIKELRAFIAHLQERNPKAKALLTSRPQAEIKEVFDGLPYIEYDKERKGSITPYILTLN